MKICAIICEFNPLHDGHAYAIAQAKKLTGCDALVCIMSGPFSQRGEICRTDKYLRARHAVYCGADAVLELPVHFAVAPAEIFAAGGVKLAAALGGEVTLAFGCESGQKRDFIAAASLLNGENETFKRELKVRLDGGESLIRARAAAFEACGGDPDVLSSPNNILGVEYAKAVLNCNKAIDICPIRRKGARYGDGELRHCFSSSTAIRLHPNDPKIANNMPAFSFEDFVASADNTTRFESLAADYLHMCDKDELIKVCGCTEGLENRLKKLAEELDYDGIVNGATCKRYSSSRIKRITCANLLKLYLPDVKKYLSEELPLKPLAVKKSAADALLPLIPSGGHAAYEKCAEAYALWRRLSSPRIFENPNDKMILV